VPVTKWSPESATAHGAAAELARKFSIAAKERRFYEREGARDAWTHHRADRMLEEDGDGRS
jgi:hypothetical protein